jgi:hypothetical protein
MNSEVFSGIKKKNVQILNNLRLKYFWIIMSERDIEGRKTTFYHKRREWSTSIYSFGIGGEMWFNYDPDSGTLKLNRDVYMDTRIESLNAHIKTKGGAIDVTMLLPIQGPVKLRGVKKITYLEEANV